MHLMLPSGKSDKSSDGKFHACLSPDPRADLPDWRESMKIFISWSGETSRAIALTLGDWIPSVIQAVETYVPPEEARKGTERIHEVSQELARSSLGILCVDPGSMAAPWLNFEAGILLKSLDVSKVIPLLFDVGRSELDNGPLARFPSVPYGKDALYQMLEMINENTEKMRLSEDRLQNTFELWWPKLDLDIEAVRGKRPEEIPPMEEPGDVPDAVETEEEPDGEMPDTDPGTKAREKMPDSDEPETEPDAEPSEVPPVTADKRGKTPDAARPEKTPESDKTEKAGDTGKREKAPERSVEPAKKSDAEKAQEKEKPKKSAPARPTVLDEIEIELLKMLYDPPGYTPVTAAAVGYKLDISAQKVREHLDHLERKNFVREHLFVGRPKEYSIAPKGRDYLTKNDLLNKRQAK